MKLGQPMALLFGPDPLIPFGPVVLWPKKKNIWRDIFLFHPIKKWHSCEIFIEECIVNFIFILWQQEEKDRPLDLNYQWNITAVLLLGVVY